MHVINGQHYSGAERVQDLLAARLPEFGYEVSFCCVKPERFPERRATKDAELFSLPMRSRVDMRPAFRLASIVKRGGYAALHAHTPRSLMVARVAAMMTGRPLVYHVHSPSSRDSTRSLQNWLNNTSERFSLAGVSRLIAVSNSLAIHMQNEGCRVEDITVVPNGVPVVDALPDRHAPDGDWTIGIVALFRPRKGLEVLLAALSELRNAGRPLRLRAIGEFESKTYRDQIHRLALELGVQDAIDWVGFTEDVNSELEQLDLFVLPSLFGEGLPMVVLEAMAAGVPVVATCVEGVPEAIRDRIDGLLAEPNDIASLRNALDTLITGQVDWTGLRREAISRHAQHFSDQRMAQRVAAVYDSILAPSRQPTGV
jgi:glycosyltransferase involved in cell wall biosynthesis